MAPDRILECVNLCFKLNTKDENSTKTIPRRPPFSVSRPSWTVSILPFKHSERRGPIRRRIVHTPCAEEVPRHFRKKKIRGPPRGGAAPRDGGGERAPDNKADPNHNSRNFSPIYSPLYKAVSGSGDHIDIVRLLVQHKADVNERGFAGFRAVTEILMFNRPECRPMDTPLSLTAHSNVAKCLILNKADPDVPCIHHKTLILARNAVAASKEIREQARCCVRQYARAIAFSRCVHPLSEFFSCYIGLRKFMGGILLGYYRPTVSEDFETDMYSKMF